jgi:hypothetical protein
MLVVSMKEGGLSSVKERAVSSGVRALGWLGARCGETVGASNGAQRRYLGPCLEIGLRASVAADCSTFGQRPV